jgi:hypothetical protein
MLFLYSFMKTSAAFPAFKQVINRLLSMLMSSANLRSNIVTMLSHVSVVAWPIVTTNLQPAS